MIDRILARLGYWRWPDTQHKPGTDVVARGQRWQAFYNEEGGMADVIAAMRRSYFERAAHVKPGDVDALMALSLADRVIAEIDGTFRQVIVSGEMEQAARDSAQRIERLPEPMRRRL